MLFMSVVGVGAVCELVQDAPNPGNQKSFTVSEFVLREDGNRVILHRDRGFSISNALPTDVWEWGTVESMTRNVLNTVLPDDDDSGEEHPWEWLAELAQSQGISVTADDLRDLPYEVVLSEELLSHLNS
jgi:hypothetical protein